MNIIHIWSATIHKSINLPQWMSKRVNKRPTLMLMENVQLPLNFHRDVKKKTALINIWSKWIITIPLHWWILSLRISGRLRAQFKCSLQWVKWERWCSSKVVGVESACGKDAAELYRQATSNWSSPAFEVLHPADDPLCGAPHIKVITSEWVTEPSS